MLIHKSLPCRQADVLTMRRILHAVRNVGLTAHDPKVFNDASKSNSASNTIHKVLHPVESIRSHKRRAADTVKNASTQSPKKIRADDAVHDVIVINDNNDVQDSDVEDLSTAHNLPGPFEGSTVDLEGLDSQMILKPFRLSTAKLGLVENNTIPCRR